MPSKSSKQERFMAAAAHDKDFAKKAGVSQDVAKEFNAADSGKKSSEATQRTKGAKKAKHERMYKS